MLIEFVQYISMFTRTVIFTMHSDEAPWKNAPNHLKTAHLQHLEDCANAQADPQLLSLQQKVAHTSWNR